MKKRTGCQLGPMLAMIGAWVTVACSDEAAEPSSGARGATDRILACTKGVLEPDWREDAPLVGSGVDAASGELKPGSYRIATSYWPVKPERAAAALELSRALIATLQSSRRLVALATGQSASCATFRSLAVWQSEEDMLDFLLSSAHLRATAETSAISRGSAQIVSWQGSAADGSWDRAVERLVGAQSAER